MPLGVWEHDREGEALEAAAGARNRPDEPDFTVEIVSSRGDHLTVQVASGALTDPAAILYVETRGPFEIVRVEPWPERMLLVLRAWSHRS